VVGVGAEDEVQRRLGRVDRLNDGGCGACGITGLFAGHLGESLVGRAGSAGVVLQPAGAAADRVLGKEVGAESAGLDQRHADSERRDFPGEGLRNPFHRHLRGCVIATAGIRRHGGHGSDVDDVPAALGPQARKRGLDYPACTVEVDGKYMLDLVVGCFLDGAQQAVAGIVDDHVDSAVQLESGGNRPRHGLRVRHIEGEHLETALPARDIRGAVTGRPDHGISSRKQGFGELAAEAT